MSDYLSERKEILDSLAKESDRIKDKRGLIKALALNLSNTLDTPYIKTLAKNVGIEEPHKKDIGKLMQRLRDKHFPNLSTRYIHECIGPEYKEVTKPVGNESKVIRLNLENEEQREQLREQIKEYDRHHTPAKDIIPKIRSSEIEKYTWNCHLAEELAMLAVKMEKEHDKHEDKLCKEYAKRAKMVRDSRFATNMNSYEAIVVACNTTDSLKHAISGEYGFKTVWEVRDDEEKCRECLGLEQCKAEGCTHECHRVVRPMTTKGLKYAIKTNEDLIELDEHIKRLTVMDNDICKIGKILLENPLTKKKLGVAAIKRLMYSHIEKDECLQCDMFLQKNPKFFDKDL